jgi:acyl dehydratase
MERILYDTASETKLATIRHTIFCRGAGGFGGDPALPSRLAPIPERDPDGSVEIATPAQLALIYRLSGDLNPLHSDPDVAREAGFNRPVLHGLSTFGIACRALLAELCRDEAARVKGFAARFSAPVYPGETLAVDFWNKAPGIALCRVRVPTRDAVVLTNAWFEYAP